MQKHPSQKTQILLWLKDGNTITALQALDMFGCLNLKGRCWDIKKMGFNIKMKLITTNTGKVIGEYSLGKTYKQTNLFD